MIIQHDPDVLTWVNGVLDPRDGAGDFLRAMAAAALRADNENYLLIRPALLELVRRYPVYLTHERARELNP